MFWKIYAGVQEYAIATHWGPFWNNQWMKFYPTDQRVTLIHKVQEVSKQQVDAAKVGWLSEFCMADTASCVDRWRLERV